MGRFALILNNINVESPVTAYFAYHRSLGKNQ